MARIVMMMGICDNIPPNAPSAAAPISAMDSAIFLAAIPDSKNPKILNEHYQKFPQQQEYFYIHLSEIQG